MRNFKHMPDKSWQLEILEEYNNLLNLIKNFDGEILPLETENSGIFYALELGKLDDIKVLIIGQDPYPKSTRAQGISFSFRDEIKPADSLRNIFTKLNESGYITNSTDLTCWAKQGVLLLNTSLTYTSKSDTEKWTKSWKPVIDSVIRKLLERKTELVVMLWGRYANLLGQFSDDKKDSELMKNGILVLRSSHPSNIGNAKNYSGNYGKLSKDIPSFMNSNQFEECNKFLREHNLAEIDWGT